MKLQYRFYLIALSFLLILSPQSGRAGPALVFEPQTGLVIYSEEADRLWHPASLTKLMTAYIAFTALRDGKLSLEDNVICSQNAQIQPPSKIGLPIGAEMSVDMALKALIIKSANDVAVMLAERIGGTEEAFVQQMNETAKRLGMDRTKFFNPHGLPHDGQVTTARDLGILARTLWEEFPEYAHLYSMASFEIGGRKLSSHNGLLKTFEGADGMKTGFICDSGFNVVASAHRDGRRIVAVILGAQSNSARTQRAAALIEHGFENYLWKTLFSTKLEHMMIDKSVSPDPGNMRNVVCAPRQARKPRRRRAK